MEHRCSDRSPLTLDVRVSYRMYNNVHGWTRDVSAGGMFVEIPYSGLPTNALVRVAIRLPGGGHADYPIAIDAMVIHVDDYGVGLMFMESGAEFKAQLQALLGDGTTASAGVQPRRAHAA